MGEPKHRANVLACLVHESPECVIDLVDNLRYLDPHAVILLYDGGTSGVCNGLHLDRRDGVVVHPASREMGWGRLHDFAIDCMRYALEELDAASLTVVDSDQLATRAGYSRQLSSFLAAHPRAGCLVSVPGVQPRSTLIGPPQAAWAEYELWRPFLRRFPDGEQRFPHWTFWPATVFTRAVAQDIVAMWQDDELQAILRTSALWASEEVLLPSLAALAGHEVVQNPFSYDFVQYRSHFGLHQVEAALRRPDVFWIHPVPRANDDPIRATLRTRFNDYLPQVPAPAAGLFEDPQRPLALTLPMIRRVEEAEGWLSAGEADLLAAAAARVLGELPGPHRMVEVGSYCGRATIVLGMVAASANPPATVYAIDPHDGILGTRDRVVPGLADSLDRLGRRLASAGISGVVQVVRGGAQDVGWESPISLLLVDHLHDFASVTADVARFQPWLVDGGLVAFHDYGQDFPGVTEFVDYLLRSGAYTAVQRIESMVVLEKAGNVVLPDVAGTLDLIRGAGGTLDAGAAVLLAMAAAQAMAPPSPAAIVQAGTHDERAARVLDRAMAGRAVPGPAEAVGMLSVAGLPDVAAAADGFRLHESLVVPGGSVALLGYADEVPGAKAFVGGVLREGRFEVAARVGGLVVLRRRPGGATPRPATEPPATSRPVPVPAPAASVAESVPAPVPLSVLRRTLVSCIMPTHNRRAFVPQAIRYFLRQDLTESELIVVDDGTDAVSDLIPNDPRIRYIRLPERHTIGQKRNIGCAQAWGEIVVHWDDDDWMAPWRLRYQVESLLNQDVDVSGLRSLLFCQASGARAWRYEYPADRQPWVADATFCYRRTLWERLPFADTSYGIDTGYLWQAPSKRIGVLENSSFYVALVHDANTSRKDTEDPWWHPYPTAEVASLMGDDWAFYEQL